MTKILLLLVAVISGLTASGCGIAGSGMVKENVTKMAALSVGMSKEEVSSIMGTEDMVGVKNPERREISQGSSGSVVDVWF
jgi:hypothetical protein